MLQSREHRRVRLGGVGQLVQHQNVGFIPQVRGYGFPDVGPGLEERRLAEGNSEQTRIQLAALQGRDLLFGDPVGGPHAAVGSPVQEQRAFADTPPAIQQDQLPMLRTSLFEQTVQKGELLVSINEHRMASLNE